MNKLIIERVNKIADYIIKTENTIRDTAKVFHVSKSTVHKDIGERLSVIDITKYEQIKKIMNNHLETRHIKGGESTRLLFLRKNHETA